MTCLVEGSRVGGFEALKSRADLVSLSAEPAFRRAADSSSIQVVMVVGGHRATTAGAGRLGLFRPPWQPSAVLTPLVGTGWPSSVKERGVWMVSQLLGWVEGSCFLLI